ncbi:glycoside hydrolase family 128 protein, partial [Aureobasidium melanogenum]
MRATSGFVIGSAFLLQNAFGQTIITPTIVITTRVSACTASSTGGLFGTTSAASDLSLSQSLIPSGFVLSSVVGSVTLGSSSPLGVPSASAATSSLVPLSLSASGISSATPSAVPVCGQPYSEGNGTDYQIACGQTYGGDVITPSRKRQQSAPSFEACIASCADLSECVASAFLLGECTLLSAIDSIINTEGAVAAIRADYIAVLAALASPSIVTTATVPGPTAGTAIIGYSSAVGEHLSQRISDNAPVPTSDNTVVYNMATSTSSSSAAAFSSQISNYISQHLSEDAPLPTGPDTVVYITSATSSEPSAIYINSTLFADYSFKCHSFKQLRCHKHCYFIVLKQSKCGSFIEPKPCLVYITIFKFVEFKQCRINHINKLCHIHSKFNAFFIVVVLNPLHTSSAVPATPTPVRNFGKRGLSYNQANLTMPFSLSGQDSQVSWAYDWFYAPCSAAGVQSCGFNPALEFVPLLYNDDPNLLSQWPAAAQFAIDNGSTALFSFNEPDFCQSGSACMNVSTAVYYHQQYMQPFAGKALIGAPAVTNSGGGTDADPMGLQYLQYFLGNCTGCTIDFINLHWYSNKYAGASYLEYYVNSARAVAAGRPIWITEFGLDSTYSYTDAELQAFLQEAMPWLDQQPDVARYAYFMDAPGILIDSAGDGISGTGMVYNNFTNSTLQPNLYTS